MQGHYAWLNRAGRSELLITRLFNAPLQRVFQAWVNPMYIKEWWGPKGFTNPTCIWEARPGGNIYIEMTYADGTVYPMGGTFHEVVAPSHIVYTSKAFANESNTFTLEVLNTVTLYEENLKTKLTLRAVITQSTPEVEEAITGMPEGWNQSLDKLEEFLAGNPIIRNH